MTNNLPPGVSVNDIPGNRPEDLAEEEFWEKLGEICPDVPQSIWDDEAVQKLVESARDLAYSAGYNQGSADEALAEAGRQSESVDPQPQGGGESGSADPQVVAKALARRELDRQEAREFAGQCFRNRHAHPRWRQWFRQALREARGV